jgi:hypothetical protein
MGPDNQKQDRTKKNGRKPSYTKLYQAIPSYTKLAIFDPSKFDPTTNSLILTPMAMSHLQCKDLWDAKDHKDPEWLVCTAVVASNFPTPLCKTYCKVT